MRLDDGPIGNQHGGDGRVAGLFKALDQVATPSHIELLPIDSDPGPFLGGILLGPAIGPAHHLTLRQDPRNHGQFLRARGFLRVVLGKDLPGGPVEGTDVLLVLLPNRVRAGGKAHQGVLPGRLPGFGSHTIDGRRGDEVVDQSFDPVSGKRFRIFHFSLPLPSSEQPRPSRYLSTASMSRGKKIFKSSSTRKSDHWPMAAWGSRLMETMKPESFMPAMC